MLPFSNMLQYEKNIYCKFGSSYYKFIFKKNLFNLFYQQLFHGKIKGDYFSYLFFQIATPYICIHVSFFPTLQKDRVECHF